MKTPVGTSETWAAPRSLAQATKDIKAKQSDLEAIILRNNRKAWADRVDQGIAEVFAETPRRDRQVPLVPGMEGTL